MGAEFGLTQAKSWDRNRDRKGELVVPGASWRFHKCLIDWST